MAKVEWEYEIVEKPFCEQLKSMGWEWLEGDTDVPELTDRTTFREVLLKGRLSAALTRINLRDGKPWLDETRIARAIRDMEQAAGHGLMEINQSATELLLKGTIADGLPDCDFGRSQPKIPPTTITDAEFEKVLQSQGSSRARAAQMQHAARYHIIGFSNQNPSYAKKMSEKLEEILQRFKDDWKQRKEELQTKARNLFWCGVMEGD